MPSLPVTWGDLSEHTVMILNVGKGHWSNAWTNWLCRPRLVDPMQKSVHPIPVHNIQEGESVTAFSARMKHWVMPGESNEDVGRVVILHSHSRKEVDKPLPETCVYLKMSADPIAEECLVTKTVDLRPWGRYSQSPVDNTLTDEERSLICKGVLLETGKEKSFLERNPFLYPIVREAKKQIKKHFGGVSVSLRLYKYHDHPYEEELIIYIHTPLAVTEAMDRLDALFQEWWIDVIDQTKGKMGLDLSFR